MAGAYGDVPDTVHDSLPVVERTILVFFRSGRCHALHDVVALHVVSQQRSAHLGYKTVRQVSYSWFGNEQTNEILFADRREV